MSKKKKRHCTKVRYVGAFAPMYYRHQGTPKSGDGPSNPTVPGTPGGSDAQGMATSVLSPATPRAEARETKRQVADGMRRAMGLLGENDPQWAGFQVPQPGMVKMRQGGPTMSGPGFDQADPVPGGIYNTQASPGLGFRSEAAWRIWRIALDVMSRDKTLPPNAIYQAALSRAGVRIGEIDPSEARLIEMGIEWALSDPKAMPTQRDSG